MYNNQISSLNFSYEDRSNRDYFTVFPSKFNTTTNISSDMDCMSIWGPVTNLNCPNEYPDCNCPTALLDLKPTFTEPTTEDLERARNLSEECFFIKQEFSIKNGFNEDEYVKWGGIDYSNKDGTYNCLGSKSYGKFAWANTLNTNGVVGPFQTTKGLTLKNGLGSPIDTSYFPYAARKGYTLGVGVSATSTAWNVSDTNNILDTNAATKAIANQAVYPTIIGQNFSYYVEYSKTNSTFWNTPETTPLYRKAQVALLKYQQIKILVNGDFTIKPGKIIIVKRPIDNRNSKILKTRYEGAWMVYKVERIIKPGKHSMYLYLMRDYPYISPDIKSDIFNQ